ncbi:hypothetical protein RsTz2092_04180 [Deferribacterales bacterium RsTz2092]|nr:hypothetical protein AGMMS49941_08270 [Deferribacterales bacterium]
MPEKMLTVPMVAARLGVSFKWVREHIRSGDLPAINLNEHLKRPTYRISEAALSVWLEVHSYNEEVAEESREAAELGL